MKRQHRSDHRNKPPRPPRGLVSGRTLERRCIEQRRSGRPAFAEHGHGVADQVSREAELRRNAG